MFRASAKFGTNWKGYQSKCPTLRTRNRGIFFQEDFDVFIMIDGPKFSPASLTLE